MKKVLVIYYSQSGQLETIARNIAKPLLNCSEVDVTFHEILLEQPFPFPWKSDEFFDAFPESFLQIPRPLKPIDQKILDTKFDLIFLNYQVWYLSPSIPVTSFLKSSEAKILLNNTPVITVSASRNMWGKTQEKVKTLLKQNNAHLKGNIALVDRAGNLISVITILDWLYSGIKKRYLGIFPMPGVSEKDIAESTKFGEVIKSSLLENKLDIIQPALVEIGATDISSYLISVDTIGNKVFTIWSNFIITKKSSRKMWLKIFYIYLVLAIWIISPIVYVLHVLTYPFKINKIRKINQYYKAI